MEAPIIAGVAHDRSEAKITVVGVPDHPGKAAEIFQTCADAEINIDMIVQNVSATETGLTDISFTCPKTDGQTGVHALRKVQESVGFASIQYDDQIGKLSLVGAGMRSHPGRLRDLLQGARRHRRQHRDDLDLRDPHLRGDPRRRARRRRARGPHRLRAGLRRGRSRGLRRHRPVTSLASTRPRPDPRPGRCHRSRRGGDPAGARDAGRHLGRDPGGRRARGRRHRPGRVRPRGRRPGADPRVLRRGRHRAGRPAGRVAAQWAPVAAARGASSSTTARPCAATPTSRWSSPRSTPRRSATGPRASSPTPVPRR